MTEIKITSLSNWHTTIAKYKSNIFKFRGQSNIDWQLIPKAGREEFSKTNDEIIFKQWKRRAKFYLNHKNLNEWELLSIAQHTGLPTRLLDWSHNPLVALFFCCFENFDIDGAVYIYPADKYVIDDKFGPFEIKNEMTFYQPTTSIERLANQYGYFSVHKNPNKNFNGNSKHGDLVKLIINKKLKPNL